MDLDERATNAPRTDGTSQQNDRDADPGPSRETSRDMSGADKGGIEASARNERPKDDLLERIAMRQGDDFLYNEVY